MTDTNAARAIIKQGKQKAARRPFPKLLRDEETDSCLKHNISILRSDPQPWRPASHSVGRWKALILWVKVR